MFTPATFDVRTFDPTLASPRQEPNSPSLKRSIPISRRFRSPAANCSSITDGLTRWFLPRTPLTTTDGCRRFWARRLQTQCVSSWCPAWDTVRAVRGPQASTLCVPWTNGSTVSYPRPSPPPTCRTERLYLRARSARIRKSRAGTAMMIPRRQPAFAVPIQIDLGDETKVPWPNAFGQAAPVYLRSSVPLAQARSWRKERND